MHRANISDSPSDLSEFTKDFFFSACRSLLLFVESWHKLLLKRMQRAPDVKQKWGSVVRAEDAEYRFLKALRLALAMMEYYVRDNDGEILDDKVGGIEKLISSLTFGTVSLR